MVWGIYYSHKVKLNESLIESGIKPSLFNFIQFFWMVRIFFKARNDASPKKTVALLFFYTQLTCRIRWNPVRFSFESWMHELCLVKAKTIFNELLNNVFLDWSKLNKQAILDEGGFSRLTSWINMLGCPHPLNIWKSLAAYFEKLDLFCLRIRRWFFE
jgi:hypothetical protein